MDSLNICRACLSREDRVQLLDWNKSIDTLENDLSYKECFFKCTQINVLLKDNQSELEARMQYLCFECAQELEEAHCFIEKARKSDHQLRCTQLEEVKLEDGIANNFEWVPVEVRESEVEVKNCTEDPKNTFKWSDHYIYDDDTPVPNDIDPHENVKSESDKPSCNKAGTSVTRNRSKKEHKKLINIRKRSQVSKKTSKGMDEVVTCEKCGKTMTRKALRKHKYIHKPKIYLCQACPRKFNDERALRKHEETHKEHRERYPCDKCGRSFASPYYLQTHLQTHENNRKPTFHCKQCDKSFLHKSGLAIHELHHKGATWVCNICQKRYVRQVDLKTHLRTHSGESSFVCHICNKSFSQKRILSRHMQYHKGYSNYTCLTCDEKFSQYDKYYAHRMQHTGLPYKCALCERKFDDSYKTKRHIRGVHKIEQDGEVEKLVVRINVTKEYRGRIVEFLKKTEDEKTSLSK